MSKIRVKLVEEITQDLLRSINSDIYLDDELLTVTRLSIEEKIYLKARINMELDKIING